MSDFVEEQLARLQQRLDQQAPLVEEHAKLERAIAALAGADGEPATGFVGETVTGLQQRRDELAGVQDEQAKLQRAIDALKGLDAAPARRAPTRGGGQGGGSGTGRRGRPKGSGKRSAQALELVRAEPGLGASEIARRIGVHANYAYRILPSLEEQGMIEKRDRAWYPKDAA